MKHVLVILSLSLFAVVWAADRISFKILQDEKTRNEFSSLIPDIGFVPSEYESLNTETQLLKNNQNDTSSHGMERVRSANMMREIIENAARSSGIAEPVIHRILQEGFAFKRDSDGSIEIQTPQPKEPHLYIGPNLSEYSSLKNPLAPRAIKNAVSRYNLEIAKRNVSVFEEQKKILGWPAPRQEATGLRVTRIGCFAESGAWV